MIPFKNIKTIFFDYDGTLHNSVKIYVPAFKKAYAFLVEKGYAESKEWSDKEISYWLGFNPQDMWEKFMPNISKELREKCSSIISNEIKVQIQQGKPILYEGSLEVLKYLKDKGYHLVLISNCKIYYKEFHSKLFKLDSYFESLVCSEEYNFNPKYDVLKNIKDKYPEDMIIIGDRKQDIEAGKKNNIYTIGCTYGFAMHNELHEADMLIDNIEELSNYL